MPSPNQPNLAIDKKLAGALTLYLTCQFVSNTIGIKLMPFLFGTHLSTAIFAFPVVFLMTDVIGEVYGKATARLFVRMGIMSLIVFLIFNSISNLMPASADFFMADAYGQIFGLSWRFTLASLVAFIIGEYQDVFSFFYLRAKFSGKYFWLRSNLSNLWGQFLDTAIWTTIAFAGVYPPKTLIMIILPWWLFKFGMGVIYTPLSYLGIKLLRGSTDNGQQ
ncbi:MAG: queuosine precursor transporter [Candidatus Buchananbacteria bacterium]|nr:queuosine precursor transporter [Candidatus Buchananbacteria bacterium]